MEDKLFFLRIEHAALETGTKIIDPTETTAFATPKKACVSGNVTPTATSISIAQHVLHQLLIFFRQLA
ncbi:hypothetical protein G2W53_010900 [Senna tora]|uniref:Uncharacterized protein n=1 Tax=Senna tora TaxID=362788 RepID=A0A835CBU9_9FABA|nr:hypothetical protein G2W53_010900 [Senna tora]